MAHLEPAVHPVSVYCGYSECSVLQGMKGFQGMPGAKGVTGSQGPPVG